MTAPTLSLICQGEIEAEELVEVAIRLTAYHEFLDQATLSLVSYIEGRPQICLRLHLFGFNANGLAQAVVALVVKNIAENGPFEP